MTTETQETTSVPAGTDALAQGLKKLVLAVVANHKAAGGAAVEVSADVEAAVADLGPALAQAGLLGGEVKARPVGVAKAFALAGLEAAEVLAGELASS